MQIKLPPNMGMPTTDNFFQAFGQLEQIMDAVFKALKKLKYKDTADRRGCYVAIFTRSQKKMVTKFFGDYSLTDNDKALKYLQCAAEKVTRMARYHLETSFERINEENEQYGGGVAFNDEVFIACSGFPPEVDEAISYIIGLFKINQGESWNEYSALTGNDLVLKLGKLIPTKGTAAAKA